MKKQDSRTQDNRAGRKRGLAPRSLLENDARRSALASLDRPIATPAAAFVRAALEPEPSPMMAGPAAAGSMTAGTATTAATTTVASATTITAAEESVVATPLAASAAAATRVLREVPIAEIDLGKRRFQYRVTRSLARLQESILLQGQQVPVILRGAQAPYEIVSGFGRCEAIAALAAQGKLDAARVWADVRGDLGDREAHEISVLENEEREGLSDLDRINKARLLRDEGYQISEIATVLKKGERMVQYYLSLSEAPRKISDALATGTLRPTHALVLTKFARDALGDLTPQEVEAKLDELIRACARGASVPELRALIVPDPGNRPYLTDRPDGFDFRAFHYSRAMTVDEKEKLMAALDEARSRIEEDVLKLD